MDKNNGTEEDKSRSRGRVGLATGHIAMGTSSHNFKSKMHIGGLAAKSNVANKPMSSAFDILNQKEQSVQDSITE